MTLMYANNLQAVPDQPCPCTDKFRPRSIEAFRFMNQAATANDFVPPAIKEGKPNKCNGFALSFFATLDAARSKYLDLSKRFDAASRYGSFIGKINIQETDGVGSDFDRNHHMDLHPNTNAIFHTREIEYHSAITNLGGPNAP